MKNKKKILFLRPPFEGMGNYIPPHLGIAMLYGYVKRSFKDEFDLFYIDGLAEKLSISDIKVRIKATEPDLIAITVKTMQVGSALEIISFTKQNTNARVVCGGNHVTVDPLIFLENGADYCIVGEGEIALKSLVDFLFHGNGNIDELTSIVTQKTQANSKIQPFIHTDIDSLGTPDWECMDMNLYNENIHIDKVNKALPIMASRGCPFSCDFCSTYLTWGHTVRYRSTEIVLEEINSSISKYGITNFHFYDDNLLLNEKWVNDFADGLMRRNMNINWICLSRPEIIFKNAHLLPLIKKAGCRGFELGYETSDKDLYNKMNKKNDNSYFAKVYELLNKERFDMIEFLIMCFYDGETLYSLWKTYHNLKTIKNQDFYFLISRYFATPLPGTSFYKKSKSVGIMLSEDFKFYYAIFMNFMPYSFINSTMEGFKINLSKLKTIFMFYHLNNLIHKEYIEEIQNRLGLESFAEYFQQFADNGCSIRDFAEYLFARFNKVFTIESIYEYVGRIIELAISKEALYYEKNLICQ